MKKHIVFIFCVCIAAVYGQTSVYHPFPDSNASWNFDYSTYQCPWGDSHEYYSIILSGDTSINGQVYQKLHVPHIDFISAGCTQVHQPGYWGAVRNDIPTKKVYYYPVYGTGEELLYDFTLEVGDTVEGHLASWWSDEPDTVIAIDSVLVGDDYHKRWFINPWYDIYLIEGVGSTYGLISPSPQNTIDAPGYYLMCFSQDGMSQYPDPTVDCDLILSVGEIQPPSALLEVYPNPTTGKFQITSTPPERHTSFSRAGKTQIQNIEVVDLYGKEVKGIVCDFEFGACLEFGICSLEVDLGGCPAGIYFIKISFKDQSVIKRIIKF